MSRRYQNMPSKGKGVRSVSVKFIFGVCLIIALIGYPLYFLLRSFDKSHKLLRQGKTVKAVVIDEKNFTGHSPVMHTYYYSYQFFVNGNVYKGNTGSSKYSVGDSVEIEYAISNPSYNSIKKRKW